MKKRYVIMEMVQTFEDGTRLFYKGYTSSVSWDKFSFALQYETRQEAEWKAADLLSEEGGTLTIIELLEN